MKQFILLGTDEPSEQEQWLLGLMNDILAKGFDRMAFVALLDDGDVCSYTAHCGMDAFSMAMAAEQLRFDATDAFIKANLERHRSMEVDEDGCGMEELEPDSWAEE